MLQKTVVVNFRFKKFEIFIGRPSKWGNPFRMGKDGTRKEVIDKYAHWIKQQPDLMRSLPTLKGKILGCYCKPHKCHGDILALLADEC